MGLKYMHFFIYPPHQHTQLYIYPEAITTPGQNDAHIALCAPKSIYIIAGLVSPLLKRTVSF